MLALLFVVTLFQSSTTSATSLPPYSVVGTVHVRPRGCPLPPPTSTIGDDAFHCNLRPPHANPSPIQFKTRSAHHKLVARTLKHLPSLHRSSMPSGAGAASNSGSKVRNHRARISHHLMARIQPSPCPSPSPGPRHSQTWPRRRKAQVCSPSPPPCPRCRAC